jgi:hypothetical protein
LLVVARALVQSSAVEAEEPPYPSRSSPCTDPSRDEKGLTFVTTTLHVESLLLKEPPPSWSAPRPGVEGSKGDVLMLEKSRLTQVLGHGVGVAWQRAWGFTHK